MLGFPLIIAISALLFSPKYWVAIAVLNHPFLVWTGKLSYSLYVWHMLAGDAAFTILPHSGGAILALGLAYVFAGASYLLVERPMIRVGKAIRQKRNKRATNSSSETTFLT